MKKADIVIIGGGLVGSMTKRILSTQFNDVIIIDEENPMAASKCSFGIFKHGWIEALGDKAEIGIEVAKMITSMESLNFINADKKQNEEFFRFDCQKILMPCDITGSVLSVKNDVVTYTVDEHPDSQVYIKAKVAVIVCAGVWTNTLLSKSGYSPKTHIDQQWGKVFRFNGNVKQNVMSLWAPFKQNVLFNESKKTYIFGDGCTVKNPTSIEDPRLDKANDRLLEHALSAGCNFDDVKEELQGYRPYIGKADEIINKIDDKLYSAVGTAKNGTVLCGWIATQLLEMLSK